MTLIEMILIMAVLAGLGSAVGILFGLVTHASLTHSAELFGGIGCLLWPAVLVIVGEATRTTDEK